MTMLTVLVFLYHFITDEDDNVDVRVDGGCRCRSESRWHCFVFFLNRTKRIWLFQITRPVLTYGAVDQAQTRLHYRLFPPTSVVFSLATSSSPSNHTQCPQLSIP